MNSLDTVLKLALMGAIIAIATPELAWGQNALEISVNNLRDGIRNMPVVVSGIAYTTGAAMLIGGALKLKSHADNPGSAPLAAGLTRLGVGGALISVPSLTGWIQSALSTSGYDPSGQGEVLPAITH